MVLDTAVPECFPTFVNCHPEAELSGAEGPAFPPQGKKPTASLQKLIALSRVAAEECSPRRKPRVK